jgi:hypothetical protein
MKPLEQPLRRLERAARVHSSGCMMKADDRPGNSVAVFRIDHFARLLSLLD